MLSGPGEILESCLRGLETGASKKSNGHKLSEIFSCVALQLVGVSCRVRKQCNRCLSRAAINAWGTMQCTLTVCVLSKL